jgi:acetate kinase
MHVLVVNAGSATLKFKLVRVAGAELTIVAQGREELAHGHGRAVAHLLARLPVRPDAVAHRCVHGGERFTSVVPVDEAVVRDLEELIPLDPLHGGAALAGIIATLGLGVPLVAAFDTAFHSTIPDVARRYALPDIAGIHRYGFHGWSYLSVVERYTELTGRTDPSLVVLHLGNGASAAAIRHGRSVDTSMGMSPLEGLVMGTRPGDLDPGVLLHLIRNGYTEERLAELLYRQSGLLGLAGDSDVRALLRREDDAARLALEIFCYRVRKYIGAYLAVLEGAAEAIVFTGGVGEHSSVIRRKIAEPFGWAGLTLGVDGDWVREQRISSEGSRLHAWVIPTREEEMIARATAELLQGPAAPAGGST